MLGVRSKPFVNALPFLPVNGRYDRCISHWWSAVGKLATGDGVAEGQRKLGVREGGGRLGREICTMS